jgi:hypothetical protein
MVTLKIAKATDILWPPESTSNVAVEIQTLRRPLTYRTYVSTVLLVSVVCMGYGDDAAKLLRKYLRVRDIEILDASYQFEIPAPEPRLQIQESALQATLDEIAQTDPRAESVKPQELIDRRFLLEPAKSGAFGK